LRNHLIQVGEALYGPRFQRELAEALGVNERTMRRWVAGDFEPPDSLMDDLLALLRERRARLGSLINSMK
jgi:DNA-binding XRE family transcriptional regulator